MRRTSLEEEKQGHEKHSLQSLRLSAWMWGSQIGQLPHGRGHQLGRRTYIRKEKREVG